MALPDLGDDTPYKELMTELKYGYFTPLSDHIVIAEGGYRLSWAIFKKLANKPYNRRARDDGFCTDLLVLLSPYRMPDQFGVSGASARNVYDFYTAGWVAKRARVKAGGELVWGWELERPEPGCAYLVHRYGRYVTCLFGGAPLDVIMGSERKKIEEEDWGALGMKEGEFLALARLTQSDFR